MPIQVIFGTGIEAILVLVTLFFLMQPERLFAKRSVGFRSAARVVGWVFLCFSFCWSVILGSILVLNNMTLQL